MLIYRLQSSCSYFCAHWLGIRWQQIVGFIRSVLHSPNFFFFISLSFPCCDLIVSHFTDRRINSAPLFVRYIFLLIFLLTFGPRAWAPEHEGIFSFDCLLNLWNLSWEFFQSPRLAVVRLGPIGSCEVKIFIRKIVKRHVTFDGRRTGKMALLNNPKVRAPRDPFLFINEWRTRSIRIFELQSFSQILLRKKFVHVNRILAGLLSPDENGMMLHESL